MRKKSARRACEWFKEEVQDVRDFADATADLSDAHVTWCHDQAIIRLYRSFENLMLSCLICAMNNDTEQISQVTGISFPQHLTDEVCEFIIVGEGYFDFKGRDGLIKTIKRYVPAGHYLLQAISHQQWREPLERLSALRNFAAHDSYPSKKAALRAVGQERMGSAGSWLKRQNRLQNLCDRIDELVDAIHAAAPY
ncbi:MAG: hypothetical protein K2Y27_31770 [Xanthobacteraceae bacterium]|nr:hypothetical protein [Xanthobacteraceae bacterium]